MATYKVIQDIEAEDHILGPLSLRQFIFALLAALCFYLCYVVSTKGASFLVAIFLPPGLFFAFFAAPFGKDQPTEIWALAKIRFFFKPRRRIWDQSGMKELVTITVPKKVEVRRTDGLTQSEVRSRLTALANTIDSRGWAVKDVDINLYTRPGILDSSNDSDRLVEAGSIPQPVPTYEVLASDDILDAQSNPIAQQFDQMITASTQAHRQQLENMLRSDATPSIENKAVAGVSPAVKDQWFMPQNTIAPAITPTDSPVIASSAQAAQTPLDDAEAALQLQAARDKAQNMVYGHMKVIQPLGHQSQQAAQMPTPAPIPLPAPAPKLPDPTTTQLSTNNDLNISTIARVANKQDLPPDEEVIIPLH